MYKFKRKSFLLGRVNNLFYLFYFRPWERMPDCDIINEIPMKLRVSKYSKTFFEEEEKSPIFIKVDSYERNYAFLDIEGRVFTAGQKYLSFF